MVPLGTYTPRPEIHMVFNAAAADQRGGARKIRRDIDRPRRSTLWSDLHAKDDAHHRAGDLLFHEFSSAQDEGSGRGSSFSQEKMVTMLICIRSARSHRISHHDIQVHAQHSYQYISPRTPSWLRASLHPSPNQPYKSTCTHAKSICQKAERLSRV